jgi:flavin-dependent dehydrogenase
MDSYDVVIVGGGPGGSTTGTLLRRYAPNARVLILERERFPRDHVGESQLPPIGAILAEMGCWDEVEAAGFPIKIGATLRWGREETLWDFDFIPYGKLEPKPRPSRFEGQRTKTAFQVDRAKYDEILLRRAETLGCEVRQETKVTGVRSDGDRIEALELSDGSSVKGSWYVDASGGAGVVRRAMNVAVETPGQLRNVACWDYWDNVDWAEEIGVEGTRVQVLSIGHGWIWFIPVSATRASIGLVVPADYYKESGRSLPELYREAVAAEPRVAALTANATSRGTPESTKDWSFLAERTFGDNWFLVGESLGFADPILAAGMTLTQTGGRELAHTLAALLSNAHDGAWLKAHYNENQRTRIAQHIRFADFWYAANGQFSDLKNHCKAIADDAGLNLSSEDAWRWLAQGGFAHDVPGQPMVGGYDLASVKMVTQKFLGEPAEWTLSRVNRLRLNVDGATRIEVPHYRGGVVHKVVAFDRGGQRLQMVGMVGLAAQAILKNPDAQTMAKTLQAELIKRMGPQGGKFAFPTALQAVEQLLGEGWVEGSVVDGRPFVRLETPKEGGGVHTHRTS